MKKTFNFHGVFSDLSDKKQHEIMGQLKAQILESQELVNYMVEKVGCDLFDIDKPDSDKIMEHVEGVVAHACDKAVFSIDIEALI